MPLVPGSKVGPYEILAAIGAGGMGEVYKARDSRLGRHVAIKTALGGFGERFEHEARTIAALNHPNICTIHDYGKARLRPARGASPRAAERAASGGGVPTSTEEDGTDVTFIVMELLEGESLRSRIHGQPLPVDLVVDVGSQIADALDAAHPRASFIAISSPRTSS